MADDDGRTRGPEDPETGPGTVLGNVIELPRIGFVPPSGNGPDSPGGHAPEGVAEDGGTVGDIPFDTSFGVPFAPTEDASEGTAEGGWETARASVWDTVEDVAGPGRAPFTDDDLDDEDDSDPDPAGDDAGEVPEPNLAALASTALVAGAMAALRGATTAAGNLRERRQERAKAKDGKGGRERPRLLRGWNTAAPRPGAAPRVPTRHAAGGGASRPGRGGLGSPGTGGARRGAAGGGSGGKGRGLSAGSSGRAGAAGGGAGKRGGGRSTGRTVSPSAGRSGGGTGGGRTHKLSGGGGKGPGGSGSSVGSRAAGAVRSLLGKGGGNGGGKNGATGTGSKGKSSGGSSGKNGAGSSGSGSGAGGKSSGKSGAKSPGSKSTGSKSVGSGGGSSAAGKLKESARRLRPARRGKGSDSADPGESGAAGPKKGRSAKRKSAAGKGSGAGKPKGSKSGAKGHGKTGGKAGADPTTESARRLKKRPKKHSPVVAKAAKAAKAKKTDKGNKPKGGTSDPTTLVGAVKAESARRLRQRWKKRRANLRPAVSKHTGGKGAGKKGRKKSRGGYDPTTLLGALRQEAVRRAKRRERSARRRLAARRANIRPVIAKVARPKHRKDRRKAATDPATPAAGVGGPLAPVPAPPPSDAPELTDELVGLAFTAVANDERSSPWEDAAAASQPPVSVAAEALNVPDSEAPGAAAPGAAKDADGTDDAIDVDEVVPGQSRAEPHPSGLPGPVPVAERRSTQQEGSSMAKSVAARKSSGAGVDSQHKTEITLDGALGRLGSTADLSLRTGEEVERLAGNLRTLASQLDEQAMDLAAAHNVTGARTQAAMAQLLEQVQVMAKTAGELVTRAMSAAELAEVANHELNDAYRPVQVATADAGLALPSARAHNSD